MFEETDKKLEQWAKEIAGNVKITFDISESADDETELCIYLLDVSPSPPGRGVRLPPHQIMLRYLLFPRGKDKNEIHRILGELLISAMEKAGFEIEKNPPSLEIWQAFGIKPTPAFFLLVPFKQERKEKIAPLVRRPLKLNQAVLETLQGKVSVNRIPMTGAKVEIPALKIYTRTDGSGFFNFASLPSEPPDKNLLIRVKEREFSVFTSQAEKLGNLLLFDLELED